MFEFTCFKNSYEKLFYKTLLFNIEIDILQSTVKEFSLSKTVVRLELY